MGNDEPLKIGMWAGISPGGVITASNYWQTSLDAAIILLGYPDDEEIHFAVQQGGWRFKYLTFTADDTVGAEQDENEKEEALKRGRKSHLGIEARSGTPEYARQYYRINKQKMIAATIRWQKEHPEELKQSQERYRLRRAQELAAAQGESASDTGEGSKSTYEDAFKDKGSEEESNPE